MKIINFLILLALLSISITSFANSKNLYAFNDPIKQTRFADLTNELRCLVCQNQNLAESNAPLAADLRTEIAGMIRTGASNAEIIHYLVRRYGDYILYNPPVVKKTWILWFGPFILLIISLSILFSIIYRLNRKEGKQIETQTDNERLQIKRVLAQLEE